MRHEIEIHLTKDVMPTPYQTVIVDGGVAYWTGKHWVCQTGTTTSRNITWPVTWWTPLIVGDIEEPEPENVRFIPAEQVSFGRAADAIEKGVGLLSRLNEIAEGILAANEAIVGFWEESREQAALQEQRNVQAASREEWYFEVAKEGEQQRTETLRETVERVVGSPPTSQPTPNLDAFISGIRCYLEGVERFDCPFTDERKLYWERGWDLRVSMSEPAAPPADRIVIAANSDSPGPQTHEEARHFHEGFLAGATAYCAAEGHPTLKSNNVKLREVFDAQRLRTIELFEKFQSEKPEVAQPTPPDRGHDA